MGLFILQASSTWPSKTQGCGDESLLLTTRDASARDKNGLLCRSGIYSTMEETTAQSSLLAPVTDIKKGLPRETFYSTV